MVSTHQAIEGARLTGQGGLDAESEHRRPGQDGVRIRLDHGVTAFRLSATIAKADSLPDGAWLEFGSRAAGSRDSLGFVRLTRTDTSGYAMRGAIGRGERADRRALPARGPRSHRDARPVSPLADLVHGQGCPLCGFSTNDDLGRPKSEGFELLRAWWAESHEFSVVNRPGGASDTIDCRGLRSVSCRKSAPAADTLSEFVLRGSDLGEVRILSERAVACSDHVLRAEEGAFRRAPASSPSAPPCS